MNTNSHFQTGTSVLKTNAQPSQFQILGTAVHNIRQNYYNEKHR